MTAFLLGGIGGAETARAASGSLVHIRFFATADTDSVSLPTRPDTLTRDSTFSHTAGPTQEDSMLVEPVQGNPLAVDTIDVEKDSIPFPDRDGLFSRLAEMPGFRVIEYRGREVELDVKDEIVRLRREAQARYSVSVLDADSIAYSAGLQIIRAHRNISLEGENQNVTSDSSVIYDVSQEKGTIMDARTSFSEQGAEWFVRGDATPRGAGTVFVEKGNFTSCELDEPHYYFRAGQLKVVSNDIVVAWPVTLYIHDVPIAWLPFFAQDIRDERRSGFLPPKFGITDIFSNSSARNRSITDFGYYIAINEFMDTQATVDWFSGRFTRVNSAFRYKAVKKFFDGNIMASYSFGDSKTFEFRVRHRHDITPVTRLRVNAIFLSDTREFERQSFDPTLQTQRISSDLGLQHRFSFASLNVSANRRQSLGAQRGRVDFTPANVQMTFSPVTLFRAPSNRAGPFNNVVLNGGFNVSRLMQTQEEDDDVTNDRGGANAGLRIGSFGVSGNANYNRRLTTPFDSLGADPASTSQTRVDYGGTADYQVDMIGSTTFRPTVNVSASSFSSEGTGNEVVAAPMRLRVGANLSTDVFGFYPGIGPFARIRHKISPRFSYAYSPAIEAEESLLTIPDFPISHAREENRLSITLNQTWEAKLREDVDLDEEAEALLEGRPFDQDSITSVRDSLVESNLEGVAADSISTPISDSLAIDSPRQVSREPNGGPRRAQQQRNVVLLGINSSPLQFDFAQKNEPVLMTDRWNHRVNSDLLRGLSLNFALDLFDGVGSGRQFSPVLSQLTGSFTFSSATGLGGLLGLGGGGSQPRSDPRNRLRGVADSRYRLQTFDENADPLDPGLRAGGPWTLSLTYSLQRGRESEQALDRQSLNATLALNPTPNWRLAWRTSYNLSDKEFGEHLITLDRDLHRWMATFLFARSPNGNFIFQMSVNLRDAPDLKFDYDQQTVDR